MKEEILDALGRMTRLANRLKNKYPELFSENDKEQIRLAQNIMAENSQIKDNEKLIQSKEI